MIPTSSDLNSTQDPAMAYNIRLKPDMPTLFEQSVAGRRGDSLRPLWTQARAPESMIPAHYLRPQPCLLPELSEPEVVRHYTRLSALNYAIDLGMYPLGSCTMKYNPKINEVVARMPGFVALHPYEPAALQQGALALMANLQDYLAEMTGLSAVTLHPSAGAQGELCGILMIRRALEKRGNARHKMIVPDSAHGTNPATASLAGYTTVKVDTNAQGMVSVESIAQLMDEDTAGLMMTCPNTLGIFEKDIQQICKIVHDRGGFVYMDGANMNALCGVARPGDFGVDVMHINLHKTFSQPHGGGGPGAGPVCANETLRPYLPVPVVVQDNGMYSLCYNKPDSIGQLRAFSCSFMVMVRAYAYIRSLGPDGILMNTHMAVLNARYLRHLLKDTFYIPYQTETLHETVFNDKWQKPYDVSTLDIAKRLIDYGYHPPTVYFPLVVQGALMIEPTESETKESLERFAEVLKQIAKEAQTQPKRLKDAPVFAPRRRFDEASAARKPILRAKRNLAPE